jgi:hypothetical protein
MSLLAGHQTMNPASASPLSLLITQIFAASLLAPLRAGVRQDLVRTMEQREIHPSDYARLAQGG